MRSYGKILAFVCPVLVCLSAYFVCFAAQNDFRLKPDARGKQCLNCHERFRDLLKKKFVHTPVKTGQCSGCHNPHTSSHGKLLAEETTAMCGKCHAGLLPAKARSIHKVVQEGKCILCHDAHAADSKFNLVRSGNALCFGCHKDLAEAVGKFKFKHRPVEQGCVSCHDPHASAQADHLLKSDRGPLCVRCHDTNRPNFVRQHMNYPMAKTRCSSCHAPHGSNTAGIFFDNRHSPVEKKMCSQCHEAPSPAASFKPKRSGYELCRACHSAMINEALAKPRVHWPLLDNRGCANCHEAHASPDKKLLKGSQKSLCGKCHSGTVAMQERLAEKERRENSATKGQVIKGSLTHKPVQEGKCGACHSAHAADGGLLLKRASVIELCATCHDWLKHSSHPMGEKVADSRNRNLRVDCLSCHRAHGTGYRHLLPFPTQTELCVQCHKQYRR